MLGSIDGLIDGETLGTFDGKALGIELGGTDGVKLGKELVLFEITSLGETDGS